MGLVCLRQRRMCDVRWWWTGRRKDESRWAGEGYGSQSVSLTAVVSGTCEGRKGERRVIDLLGLPAVDDGWLECV